MDTLVRLFILPAIILLSVLHLSAQTENKDVTITTSGSGKTIEEAKQAALRSAVEQAFGAFISSKTEMFNDHIVADQMASVSSGNIKSFEILNEDQLPDGRWGVTIRSVVSVDKLTSFVQAKGIEIEIKGGMFALNIKQQLLNEQGEIKAVAEMIGLLHEPMQISFDYVIKSSDPKSLDAESKNWEIPLVVKATCNKNIDFCANYFRNTLLALSLSAEEVETYKSLKKQVFPVKVTYQSQTVTYYLRKQSSINVINSFTSNWNFYTRLFFVQSGIFELNNNREENIFAFTGSTYDWSVTINFPTSGQTAGTFSWSDKRTLSEIEQMTGYSVKPLGIVSKFKNGGYLVFEKNGHGLVTSLFDIGKFEWSDAKAACNDLNINGYCDWRLPSVEELELMYENLFKMGVGDLSGILFSCTNTLRGTFNFEGGIAYYGYTGNHTYKVRAVRTF